ncbi:MAG: pimeloyl-ACP methyl ester carboxylesterase [Rubritalea sp.]|jgi:pimeloyl-ACP methyl ester carboxylesterase
MKPNQIENNEDTAHASTTEDACDVMLAAVNEADANDKDTCAKPSEQGAGIVSKALLMGVLMTFTGLASTISASADESREVSITAAKSTIVSLAHQAVKHKYVEIEGQRIFYREAGSKNAPTVLLLHGFPTSSHMFRNLIPQLADKYHVIAPDMPGYGQSSAPSVKEFDYTFDHMASIIEQFTVKTGLEKYSLYLMDYGAPVGFRLAAKNPGKVQSLIIQNGNAYDEGLREFWVPLKAYWKDQSVKNTDALRGLLTIDATKWQYTHGVRNEATISPDNWTIDQRLLDRKGNQEIQLAMFLSYGSNPPLYSEWQTYLRKHQPPTLIVWGKNDKIFPADGAHPYKKHLKNLEFHLLDTGHFALEEDGDKIAQLMREFL